MKLSQWCKKQGVTLRTGYNWFHAGHLPNAKQLPSGTILVDEQQPVNIIEKVVIYARVSSNKQKQDLNRQIQRLEKHCSSKNYKVERVYKEVASGMNDKRRELWKMLNYNPNLIVIENKDRLTRFGFEYLEKLLSKQNCNIEVVHHDNEDESDLIKDLVSIITSFCARIYGLRRGNSKSKKIKEVLDANN
jgi:predicted site-specific integrase-resolvase